MENIFIYLFKHFKIPYTKNIKFYMRFVYSVYDITKILDLYKIENVAIRLKKENLNQLPLPAIIYYPMGMLDFCVLLKTEGDILHLTDGMGKNMYLPFDKYKSSSNDLVILLSPTPFSKEPNYEYNKQTRLSIWISDLIVLIITGAFFSSLIFQSIFSEFYLNAFRFLNLVGVIIAFFIVKKEYFKDSSGVVDQICSSFKKTDCNTVLTSSYGKLFNWLSWGDISLIGFSSILIYLSIVKSIGITLILFTLICIMFSIFSIYYQLRKIKIWCFLCLIVISISVLNFLFLISFKEKIVWSLFQDLEIGFFCLSFFFIVFLLLKPYIINSYAINKYKEAIFNWEKNDNLIIGSLKYRNTRDLYFVSCEQSDICFGNKDGTLKLLLILSPFCKECKKTFDEAIALSKVFSEEIGITVRFDCDFSSNKTNDFVKHLLNLKETIRFKAIEDWFNVQNIDLFKKEYNSFLDNTSSMTFDNLAHWVKGIDVNYTPTIFINNKEIENTYNIQSLSMHVKKIIEFERG